VESVLRQTWRDVETIVVDDGSTDDTATVLAPYFNEPRFRYIRQTNRGLPGARNAGARASHAEYLAFLDADDELAPNALELMRAELESSGASWCIIDILKVRETAREVQRTAMPSRDMFHGILKEDFIRRAMFFRRRDFIDIGMYDESMKYREDWEINIRMFERNAPFVYLAQPLYLYSWREGSITTANKPGVLHYTEMVLRKHHKRIADAGDDAVAKIYAANMWDLGRRYFYLLRNYRRAFACVRESLAYDPSPGRLLHPLAHNSRRLMAACGVRIRSHENSV
jgi:glycosyltransferase involved in cell wall biosynthesis